MISDIPETIRARLDGPALLLPIAENQKAPVDKGWEKFTCAKMDDPVYRKRLNRSPNIGVSLGQASEGLCTVDLDDAQAAETFFALNPSLRGALQTSRVRGCNVWLRIEGDYPSPAKLTLKSDKKVKFGEWRATGNQTVIHGQAIDLDPRKGETEPTAYRVLVDAPPARLTFPQIVWPEDWRVPGEPSAEEMNEADDRKLHEEHGQPFTVSDRGKITLNPMYFVGRYALEHHVLHEPNEGEFFGYYAEGGDWRKQTVAAIKVQFAQDLKAFADAQSPGNATQIHNSRHDRFLAGLVNMLQGYVEERDAFERTPGVIHLLNGMLHFDVDPPVLREFHPGHRSRNVTPVAYDPAAKCERFIRELLQSALPQDDISLIQRYAGALLLNHNAAQRILVLTGTANGGKSTLVDLFERIIGKTNVGELRTEHLADRFEIGRYIGRTLLTGKDVEGEFLQTPGAQKLKKLVGHDLVDAELKSSNGQFQIRGDFGVLITCNSRLRVRLDGDADAWRRRLLIVNYNRPKPTQRIADFADMLLEAEGPGILAWMVEGARLHLRELGEHGDFVLTAAQQRRVDSLLAESDSLRQFIRERVERHSGDDVAVFELLDAYTLYCDEMGWMPLASRRVENALADAMQELCRASKRNDIQRGGPRKGFSGVRLKQHVEVLAHAA